MDMATDYGALMAMGAREQRREEPDFHRVEDKHAGIHARLSNWGRWCNGTGSPATSPMFRLYVAPARGREGGVPTVYGRQVDQQDAARIARAVVQLPEKHRRATQWCYVKPVNPRRAAQDIGVTLQELALLVRDARQMLVNRNA